MSEVKRYNFFVAKTLKDQGRNADFVLASDFDAALDREAALRKELDEKQAFAEMFYQKQRLAETKQRNAERKLADSEQRNAELRQEIAILHAINETPDENMLWDVLNATVEIITRCADPHALESEAHNAGAKVILDRRAGLAATYLKPTESGASE